MLSLETAKFLTSTDGVRLLEEYKRYSDVELDKILLKRSKTGDIGNLREIVTLLKLRRKAQGKFRKAVELYFTPDGLEQATGEELADYIAEEFTKEIPQGSVVLDIGSGIGGNSLTLAKYFKVIAVDSDPVHLLFAEANAEIYGVRENIEFICCDAEEYLDAKPMDVRAFFFDPQRMRDGRTKTRSLFNSEPSVSKILPRIVEITGSGCIKISPAFDFGEVESLLGEPAVEVVSENNNNKLGLLWFGELKSFRRRATCFLGSGGKKSLEGGRESPEVRIAEQIGRYLYEPNKAVIKAHLIDEVAYRHKLDKVNPKIAFLTSDTLVAGEDRAMFRIFDVEAVVCGSLSVFKGELKKRGVSSADITVRGFFLKPEELRKKLKLKEGGDNTILVTRTKDEKVCYVLTKRVLA